MDFIINLPPLVLVIIGLLAGVLSMRLLNNKDKTTIVKLSTDLAVSEEKLKQFQNKESEFRQLQQLYIETKTRNVKFSTNATGNLLNTIKPVWIISLSRCASS